MGNVVEMQNIFNKNIIYISEEYENVTVYDLNGNVLNVFNFNINFVVMLYVLQFFKIVNNNVKRI